MRYKFTEAERLEQKKQIRDLAATFYGILNEMEKAHPVPAPKPDEKKGAAK
jgi:hypothetical protein